ncbi:MULTISPECIES: hypothetical protein [Mycobacterium]|uniref:ARB-07466-like C-terminal domain-containing protein n=1 Tax=Mycobacterium kiyosense TaxID=2871094 RepID=A0A9P3V1N1_9MYCO|nr:MULTISPECIES: hypothetical protein [Mycobacterium]BDB40165.1 hypothetical protein IWGMT90018_06110 [Mycobacterium kiyosense]BDE11998.1 hypothetical protein MKCMC460_08580 [Mycobacterium sp. 20KCMC460]GLB85173.1 hypothetical protein SRL2020028_44290 [Mycobacterium kiyosense]GLB93178.1 hypothetical protein SRL2020130_59950 [Mycobacterium kiyosense]GLB99105.1 hypothetical protein SRL2020226_58810 [Mycobacterium kiyosense]
MGRHELATKRRKAPAWLAKAIVPAAALFAVAGALGADVNPTAARAEIKPVATNNSRPPCCIQIATEEAQALDTSRMRFDIEEMAPAQRTRADRSRVDLGSRALPAGRAPEQGLQVKTILVERAISAMFPEIHQMGGVRPDALRWHPEGLAVDVMIPDPSSEEGIELGNAIVTFVMQNADRFGIQDAIWRGTYYTPGGGAQSGGYGHYDHVHVTTTGGGYPTGDEIYVR